MPLMQRGVMEAEAKSAIPFTGVIPAKAGTSVCCGCSRQAGTSRAMPGTVHRGHLLLRQQRFPLSRE
ncbi:MAG: hypothetical protein BGO82_15200 [Devosia sp. 67-54]|nr:MAG: hypothetical protein BGO82_15200 [Devosia sp. 67-54]